MPIDPKIPIARPAVRVTTPVPAPVKPQATPVPTTLQPSGYKAASTFDTIRQPSPKRDGIPDDSIGRRQQGGIADDGIGRAKQGGIADDGIGRKGAGGIADDGIGRKGAGGIADDGIGRTKKGGIADDGIGGGSYEAALDALVGRNDTDDSLALRDAIYQRMEQPSFLKGSATVPAQVAAFAKTLKLSPAQQAQVDSLLRGSTKETATLVGALLEKTPEVLTTVDGNGQTALANLARIATQPLNTKMAGDTTKGELLSSVLREIINPNRIDQGDAPTCTVTSMQFELAADEPAEYLRLIADLSGPEGKSKMRGGSFLELEAGDAGARDGRSISDTIFQTAAMEFGNGRDGQFDPYAGKSVNTKTGAEQRGLKPAQQTQVLRQLFGVNYESKNFLNEAEGAKALEKLRGYDTRGAQNRPIILQIDQGDFNHAVTFERVSDQRVYFRDPYGVLRSMPEQQFPKFVMAVNAPRDLNIV